MEIEKIPSLMCDKCGGTNAMIVDGVLECDDCERITAQSSDLLKSKQKTVILLNNGEDK